MFFNRKKTFSLLIALIFLTSGSAQAFAGTLEAPTTITVFAASSLLKTFTVLGKIFQQTYPGTKVEFSFLASSTLATQLMSGAPADVFASASPIDMEAVVSLVPKPVVFVTNRVVLAVPRANPLRIFRIKDLNNPKVKWIQCAHQVPCGIAADAALSAEGNMTAKPESLEPKASSVVTKILAGEVDAAIVYRTDITAHITALRGIAFRNVAASTTKYLIGEVSRSRHEAISRAFVDLILSVRGKQILYRAGFERVK